MTSFGDWLGKPSTTALLDRLLEQTGPTVHREKPVRLATVCPCGRTAWHVRTHDDGTLEFQCSAGDITCRAK